MNGYQLYDFTVLYCGPEENDKPEIIEYGREVAKSASGLSIRLARRIPEQYSDRLDNVRIEITLIGGYEASGGKQLLRSSEPKSLGHSTLGSHSWYDDNTKYDTNASYTVMAVDCINK